MEKRHTLIHNAAEHRYEFRLDDSARAWIEYEPRPEGLALTHTIVPPRFEGQGIAAGLTAAVLRTLRDEGVRIIPLCSYVVRYIERHPEWQEMAAATPHAGQSGQEQAGTGWDRQE